MLTPRPWILRCSSRPYGEHDDLGCRRSAINSAQEVAPVHGVREHPVSRREQASQVDLTKKKKKKSLLAFFSAQALASYTPVGDRPSANRCFGHQRETSHKPRGPAWSGPVY